MKTIVQSLMELLNIYFDKEMEHCIGSVYKQKDKQYIDITISHWGKDDFWTSKLLSKVLKEGLVLIRFESPEEKVITGVFGIK